MMKKEGWRGIQIQRRLFAIWVTATALVGCDGDASKSSTFGVSRDTLPNGAVVISYSALPATVMRRAEVNLTIGSVEGDPNMIFGDVRGIEAGADGTVFVLDYQASEIRAYDPEGTFLHTISSRGEGPGELGGANGMILAGDTLLWVQDHSKWMMLAITRDGEERQRIPMPALNYGYMWNGTVDQAGRLWKPTSHSEEEQSYPPEEGLQEATSRSYMLWHDPATQITDSIFLGETTYRSYVARNSLGGYSYLGVRSDALPITVVDPRGWLWRTDGQGYRVTRLSERGDTVLVIESDTPPLPVTMRDRGDMVTEIVERDPSLQRAAEEVSGLMPDTWPAISGLVIDDEGLLWVRRRVSSDAFPFYDIFTSEGTYRGSLELTFHASEFLPIRIRNQNIYALVTDSLGVPLVVRARVPQ